MDKDPPASVVPLWTKFFYSLPNFPLAALGVPISIHVNKFYIDDIGIGPGRLAVIIAIARMFDFIVDPTVGWVSDRTKSRWGRRRPYLAVCAPLCAAVFVMLLNPPASLTISEASVWFGITFSLYLMLHVFLVIPHRSLGPELTQGYEERSKLFAWAFAFGLVGTMCAAVTPGLLQTQIESRRQVFAILGWVIAVLLVIFYFLLVAYVPEKYVFHHDLTEHEKEIMQQVGNPLVSGLRRTFRNGAFIVLLVVHCFLSISAVGGTSLMPFFVEYVLKVDKPDTWTGINLGLAIIAALFSIPLWRFVEHKTDKKTAWIIALILSTPVGAGVWLLGEGDIIPYCCLTAWSGLTGGGLIYLFRSMRADVIDLDELRTGKRREGQYLTFWTLVPKWIQIPASALPLAVLQYYGYIPKATTQNDDVIWALRVLKGTIPFVSTFAAAVIAFMYPLTRRVHHAIISGLEARQSKVGEVVTDPLSGYEILLGHDTKGLTDDECWHLEHFDYYELSELSRLGMKTRGWNFLRNFVLLKTMLTCTLFVCTFWLCVEYGDRAQAAVPWMMASSFSLAAFGYQCLRLLAVHELHKLDISPVALEIFLDKCDRERPAQNRNSWIWCWIGCLAPRSPPPKRKHPNHLGSGSDTTVVKTRDKFV